MIKKISLLIIISLIGSVALFYSYFAFRESKTGAYIYGYVYETKIENYLKDGVGADYFTTNFQFIGHRQGELHGPPVHNLGTIYYTYKFLPFSEKYDYTIDINVNKSTGGISGYSLPRCAMDKNSGIDRCKFKISYSEAYDMGLQKLNGGHISVELLKKDQRYYWEASKLTGGSWDCQPETTSFHINTDSGQTTPLEINKSNWCV